MTTHARHTVQRPKLLFSAWHQRPTANRRLFCPPALMGKQVLIHWLACMYEAAVGVLGFAQTWAFPHFQAPCIQPPVPTCIRSGCRPLLACQHRVLFRLATVFFRSADAMRRGNGLPLLRTSWARYLPSRLTACHGSRTDLHRVRIGKYIPAAVYVASNAPHTYSSVASPTTDSQSTARTATNSSRRGYRPVRQSASTLNVRSSGGRGKRVTWPRPTAPHNNLSISKVPSISPESPLPQRHPFGRAGPGLSRKHGHEWHGWHGEHGYLTTTCHALLRPSSPPPQLPPVCDGHCFPRHAGLFHPLTSRPRGPACSPSLTKRGALPKYGSASSVMVGLGPTLRDRRS